MLISFIRGLLYADLFGDDFKVFLFKVTGDPTRREDGRDGTDIPHGSYGSFDCNKIKISLLKNNNSSLLRYCLSLILLSY